MILQKIRFEHSMGSEMCTSGRQVDRRNRIKRFLNMRSNFYFCLDLLHSAEASESDLIRAENGDICTVSYEFKPNVQ